MPLVCVSVPDLAPSKLNDHCVELGGIFHPPQVAQSCTHKLLCPGCMLCCAGLTAQLLCLKQLKGSPGSSALSASAQHRHGLLLGQDSQK